MSPQTIVSALETQGHVSVQPFPTSVIPQPTIITPNLSISYPILSLLTVTAPLLYKPTSRAVIMNSSQTLAGSLKAHNFTNQDSRTLAKRGPLPTMSIIDIFKTTATGSPPNQIASRNDHPVPKLGIVRLTSFLRPM